MTSWSEDPVVALFKLGEEAHMRALLEQGHVFMNTPSFFAHCEEPGPRRDCDEALAYCEQADGATLSRQNAQGVWEELGTLRDQLHIHAPDLQTANLYCLHARRRSDFGKLFRLDELGFGGFYVVILNADEFLRRLARAATEQGVSVDCDLVEYVDRRTYSGPMGVFRKFSEYEHQREFRVAAMPGLGRPLSLYLGDLSDIAILRSAGDRLRLVPKAVPSPGVGAVLQHGNSLLSA